MNKLQALFASAPLNKKQVLLYSATVAAFAFGSDAMAGVGGSTEFDSIVTVLTNWSTGSLGKTIALGMFIVGLAAGIVDQSVIAVVVGVAGALALSYGPTVLTGIFTAVI
jgi:conjugal transfer pilus assembly protein TraA